MWVVWDCFNGTFAVALITSNRDEGEALVYALREAGFKDAYYMDFVKGLAR